MAATTLIPIEVYMRTSYRPDISPSRSQKKPCLRKTDNHLSVVKGTGW